ncbi:uncharacterized protein TRIADDRAFT_29232 [Trichoplax adhaerens]|uniref:Uncharacterized protein n=1 Tax=Trichoplax adhaerens TaxID=10228 RepID=B3S545_TRIAD|nr:hypothetical protein TRIADDRAFT_29232 [Trichoplax adhaerens]EDV22201.1 hypothetical protein TRIADDRAFT_29232 [Trichoplax adhaerens]|eukprot:XP_002115356.1 hypothetical protein TRIADDRAFT_29232 [Trichoplax adhaerens]
MSSSQTSDSIEIDQNHDTRYLINNNDKVNGGNTQTDEAEVRVKILKPFTLPFMRYNNLLRLILLIDGITCVTLWLAGGDSTQLRKSIFHFTITTSVFDLACLALARMILLFLLWTRFEDTAAIIIDHPRGTGLLRRKTIVLFLSILFTLGFMAYSMAKLILLYLPASKADRAAMNSSYVGCAIASLVFTLIELVATLPANTLISRVGQYRKFNPSKGTANLRRVLGLAKEEFWIILGGVLALLVSSGTLMIAPYFFGQVINNAITRNEGLNTTVVILLAIYVGGSIASFFRSWLFTLAGERLVARIRKMLFNAIIVQEIGFFDKNRTGELTNRLSSDTAVIQNAVTVNISMLLRYILQIIGSLIVMFILSPSVTGVLLAVVPIIAIMAVLYGRKLRDLRKKFQDELANASNVAEETIGNIRTVRSFNGEKKTMNHYGEMIENSYNIGRKLALYTGLFNGYMGIFAQGAIVLVLWFGAKQVLEGHLTAGLLTSFMLYALNVAMAFAFITSLYGDFMQAVGASVRMFELMDRDPELKLEGGLKPQKFQGVLEFKEVSFKYPARSDTEVLKDINFKIKPGEMVALVGPSGGGKSTTVNLIEQFYHPNTGSIALGDDDLRNVDAVWLRDNIGLVSQEPILFACSIYDNIQYGCDATRSEIEEAAKQANAHDFITSFSEGYDTLVGERGVRLSGGQKQRVAIARALIKNPSLLLLDEATSALDAESEYLVQEAIDRAMNGRTVLVIAHRLSTVRSASKVLVIDKGRIVEEGTHDQLIEQGGVYKKLVLRQLTAGATTNPSENTA